MPNAILPKYAAEQTLAITLGDGVNGLASSTTGAGRQSTMVDNSVTRFKRIRLFIKLTQGAGGTGSKGAYVLALRGDGNTGSPHRTDNAGSGDAALTALNAPLIGVIGNQASAPSGAVYGEFVLEDPGPEWGVLIYHDFGVNLSATGANHYVKWIGEYDEIQ